jgi:flagellar basal-body rod protein FlgC
MFSMLDMSASALSAYRVRMDTIANNVANMYTTRDAEGRSIAYRRRVALFAAGSTAAGGQGVRVTGIVEDPSPLKKVYEPGHPDAVASGPDAGYVFYPNVSSEVEMVDMIAATRAYQANVTAYEAGKSIFASALRLIL